MIRKAANKEKYPTGYQPRKRLSPDAIAGIRALHAQFPDVYDAANLARQFGVEYDAVGRILKSRWRPSEEAEEEMRARWERRGQRVWGQIEQVEGIQPPSKWRRKGMKIDPLGDA